MPTYNAGGGYDYSDNKLWGYSLTHVSGPGCGAAGDVPMVPTDRRRSPPATRTMITTAFSHTSEVAQAGYYSAQSNAAEHDHLGVHGDARTARWRASPTRPRRRPTS